MVNKQTVDEFYGQKRIAIIAVSRDKKEYSRICYGRRWKRKKPA